MKLGKKYFKICDRIAELEYKLTELYGYMEGTGTAMMTVLACSREEAIVSLYIAVKNGVNVLSKPSDEFQERKYQFKKNYFLIQKNL
jgi:hypothetical protein